MKKTAYIILCRYSSSRLPGKILKEINGKKVIDYIVERLKKVVPLENIIIATSDETSDKPIENYAHNQGIKIFRGSLENVAERFFNAAQNEDYEYITRINGDNVFLDTKVLKEMITIAEENNYDFISNVKNRTYPKGMSIEIVKKEHYLKLLPEINKSVYHREHVTSYLYENGESQNYYYHFNTTLPEVAGIQMALDTQEDFERTEKIISQFTKKHTEYNLAEIYSIYKNILHERSI